MKIFSIILFAISTFFLITASSCRKDPGEGDPSSILNDDLRSANDNVLVNDIFNDVFLQVVNFTTLTSMNNSECALVEVVPDTLYPATYTIDFGTGCEFYNHKRSGKITISLSDNLKLKDAVATVSFNEYVVDNFRVSGSQTITNIGYNVSNNLNYDISIKNVVITKPDNKTINWSSITKRELISGAGTKYISDDLYVVTGTHEGENSQGVSYSAKISEENPLNVFLGCNKVVAGSYTIKTSGKDDVIVDFGNGDCDTQDHKASINGFDYGITYN